MRTSARQDGPLEITPGCDLPTWRGNPKLHMQGCPNCGAGPAAIKPWSGGEIDLGRAINAQNIEGFWVTHGCTLHADAGVSRCLECWRDIYEVNFGLIDNAPVSPDASSEFLLGHEELDKPENALFTVTSKLRGLPDRWFVSRMETPVGWVDWHYFGLFVATETVLCLLCGRSIPPEEWCCCSKRPQPVYDGQVYPGPDRKLWTEAEGLLRRVWPLVVFLMDEWEGFARVCANAAEGR